MHYIFISYDPLFPLLFDKEKKYLQSLFGKKTIIEHFGSTAVPGLGGKGVIDLYVLVKKSKMQKVSVILANNKYLYSDFFKDENHFLFQADKAYQGKIYHYHIHLSPIGSKNFADCIKFRDYLRSCPKAAEEYAGLKRKAIKEINGMTDKKQIVRKYLKAKDPFVKNIIKK